MALALWLGDKFNRLYLNNVNTPDVKGVTMSLDLLPERRVAAIERGGANTEVQAGDDLPVKVSVRPYRGEPIQREVIVKIPAGLAKGDHRILLSDADTLNRMQNNAGFMNRFIDVPAGGLAAQPGADKQPAVCFPGESQSHGLFRRQDDAQHAFRVLNVIQAGRASTALWSPRRRQRRSRPRFLRLHGDGQLLPANSCEVAKLTSSMKILILLLGASSVLSAGQTRTWTQGEAADFEKGILKNLSLRSDGRLTLAPLSREVFDTSSPTYGRWHRTPRQLVCRSGTSAKLYRIPPDGKGKLLAELDALEIHAIAVDSRDRVYAATSPDGKIYRITGSGKPEVFLRSQGEIHLGTGLRCAGNLFVARAIRANCIA
jgi:hypothetical protein